MKLPLSLPPASRAVDFIAVGENSVDVIAVKNSTPGSGSKHDLETLTFLPGGQAATAAVACCRLGWRSRYIGCVGNDPITGRIAGDLAREGVDARLIERTEVRGRMAVVLIERVSGHRTIYAHRDPAMQLRPDEIDRDLLRDGRVLLVDASNLDAATYAARVAREAGIPTMVDVDRPIPGLDALLSLIDLLIVSDDFPCAMTGATGVGEGLAKLAARYQPSVAIVTLGAEGSLARCGTSEIRTPAPAVAVRDTTGAGDAFRGGFAAGWLEAGDGADLEQVLVFANAVAALNCRAIGAQLGLPGRNDLAGLL